MRRYVCVALAAAVLSACGGASDGSSGYTTGPVTKPPVTGGSSNPVATNSVTMASDNSFTPASISVTKGTTVTWTWPGCGDGYGGYGTCVTHSVTFDDGSNIASATQTDGTFSRTFATTGTFKYHC